MDPIIVLRAILYRLREGGSWRALSIFGAWQTIYGHWRRWADSGVLDEILADFAAGAKGSLWSVDSTSIKVHKHGHGGEGGPEAQQIGTSRGGANTKVHGLADSRGRLLTIVLSPGNRHDLVFAIPAISIATEGVTILADKAYDSDEFRAYLDEHGLGSCIPPKSNRKNPPAYNRRNYRKRHRVENAFQRLKEYRGAATRYEKLGSTFKAFVTIAALLDWL